MKTDSLFASGDRTFLDLYGTYVDSFLTYLRAKGYAERTLRKKRSIILTFARWNVKKQFTEGDLDESHLNVFLERSSGRKKTCINFETSALRPFLNYLRREIGIPTPPLVTRSSPAKDLIVIDAKKHTSLPTRT